MEAENAKRLLAEAHLDIEALKIGFEVNANSKRPVEGCQKVPGRG